MWNPVLECAFEISSMGIRVSPESMDRQLTMAGCDDRRTLPFHKAVLSGELPYTIGGGIGHEKENLLVPLRKMVERERYSIHAKVQTQIISAELGNDAGLIGAALLDR